MGINIVIPWRLKLIGKLLLSRLPVKYAYWRRVALFKHGHMERPEYAFQVVRSHFDRTEFARKKGGFVAMEIGPGDSLLSSLVLHALGARSTYLIDVEKFARCDFAPYVGMVKYLEERGYTLDTLGSISNLSTMLNRVNCQYLVGGLESVRQIPDGSVDFIWSQAVLEHVRLKELNQLLQETRRVLRPDGVCSHRVDLKDHLGAALNNLRFSHKLWESDCFARSGFYTNRVRFKEMLKRFRDAGFEIVSVSPELFSRLPTPRSRLAAEFSGLDEDDLMVSGFDAILRPV